MDITQGIKFQKVSNFNFSFHADSDKKSKVGFSHFCLCCGCRLTSKNRSEVSNLCESCNTALEF